jgi:hypothetical protein
VVFCLFAARFTLIQAFLKVRSLPRFFWYSKLSIPLLFILFLTLDAFGQVPAKKDYIVVADSALSQGFVRDIPSEGNTVVYFAKSKRSEHKKFTVADVTEFRLSERMFYKKLIPQGVAGRFVFLEKLPHSSPNLVFWKLHEESPKYYIESSEGLELLDESFRGRLSELFDNPMLNPLLDITRRNDFSLVYLSRTAATIKKPRTFTKLFAIAPHLGYTSQIVRFALPDSNEKGKVTGSSPSIGIDGEVFLTFKRNISLMAGVLWTQFDSQVFIQYPRSQTRIDSDFFLDFSLLQIPAMFRYYIDLSPNKLRMHIGAGYTHAKPSYDRLGAYQAVFEGTTIVTSTRELEMDDSFSGVTLGLGIEKYFRKQRALVFGLRHFNVKGQEDGLVQGLDFQLGYKF